MEQLSIENLKNKKEYLLERKSLLKVQGGNGRSGGTQQTAGYDLSNAKPV
ncbi:hypothetical protein ABW636_17785 [Aquimarina sp. 2201CG1-2-11]